MKIAVYDEKKPEDILRLKLFQDGNTVQLKVVDSSGEPVRSGLLLELSADGIKLFQAVDEHLGLPLMVKGYVKVTKE